MGGWKQLLITVSLVADSRSGFINDRLKSIPLLVKQVECLLLEPTVALY